jgi:CheY-like chemotaxis protein
MNISEHLDISDKSENASKLGLDANKPSSFQVLIIDDDKWTTRVLVNFVEMWGFKAIHALDPIDGIAMAIKHQPHLIFLDLLMPELYGNIVLKILKRVDITHDIPVIIVSAHFDEKFLVETYKEGAEAFISKPFKRGILIQKIEQSLGYPLFSFFGISNIPQED